MSTLIKNKLKSVIQKFSFFLQKPELRVQMYDALKQTHTETDLQSLTNYLNDNFDPIDLIAVCSGLSQRASKEIKENFIIQRKAKDSSS